MSTQSAVLFDLDGTLLDTAPEFAFCLNALLQAQSLPLVCPERLRPHVSQGASGMIHYAFAHHLIQEHHDTLKKQFLSTYKQHIGSQTQFFSGVPALLHILQATGIPWGIVTNKPQEYTLPLVQQFSPLDRAGCLISGDTLPVSKPHPDPLLLGAQQLGFPPEACWYVGDARTDVIASRAAGMRPIVVNYGYLPLDDDPFTWQADHYCDHPESIFNILQTK